MPSCWKPPSMGTGAAPSNPNGSKDVPSPAFPADSSGSTANGRQFTSADITSMDDDILALLSENASISKQKQWGDEDVRLLKRALKKFPSTMDKATRWARIAKAVGSDVTVSDCKSKFKELKSHSRSASSNTSSSVRQWSDRNLRHLKRAIAKFPSSMSKSQRWDSIAEAVGHGFTKKDCLKKVKELKGKAVKKATPEKVVSTRSDSAAPTHHSRSKQKPQEDVMTKPTTLKSSDAPKNQTGDLSSRPASVAWGSSPAQHSTLKQKPQEDVMTKSTTLKSSHEPKSSQGRLSSRPASAAWGSSPGHQVSGSDAVQASSSLSSRNHANQSPTVNDAGSAVPLSGDLETLKLDGTSDAPARELDTVKERSSRPAKVSAVKTAPEGRETERQERKTTLQPTRTSEVSAVDHREDERSRSKTPSERLAMAACGKSWTAAHVESLKRALKKYPSSMDKATRWAHIAKSVGSGFTARDCRAKVKELKSHSRSGASARAASARKGNASASGGALREWNDRTLRQLKRAVAKFPSSIEKSERWNRIAEAVGQGFTKKDCYMKVKELKTQAKASKRRPQSSTASATAQATSDK